MLSRISSGGIDSPSSQSVKAARESRQESSASQSGSNFLRNTLFARANRYATRALPIERLRRFPALGLCQFGLRQCGREILARSPFCIVKRAPRPFTTDKSHVATMGGEF